MPAEKIKISAVSFANTYPFIYGLTESGFDRKVILSIDHPAGCAAKLIEGSVDIGLIPVAVLPLMNEYHIITDFCLGAYGNVRTVMLLSNCLFNKIRTINLDYRSHSSVKLAKILAKNLWKRDFIWNDTQEGFDFKHIPDNEAVVLIGDLCFEYDKFFRFRIDLAGEWYKFTGLPFAFACWTSNKELDAGFLDDFNDALKTGVENIPAVVQKFGNSGTIRGNDLFEYLTKNMNYNLNDDKRKAIKLFLDMMSSL
jgi:chorismate dehydratase